MRLPMRLAAMATCAGLVLAGCSDSEAGTARPAEPTSTTDSNGRPTSGTSSRTTSSSASSPLSKVDPCTLLSDSERTQLRLEPGKPDKVAGSRVCDWRSDVAGVLVGLRETLAFKDADLRGATPIQVDIGRHEAYKVENAGGGKGACEIFVVTGKTSLAQITVTKLSDTAGACVQALAAAKIIDPKLP